LLQCRFDSGSCEHSRYVPMLLLPYSNTALQLGFCWQTHVSSHLPCYRRLPVPNCVCPEARGYICIMSYTLKACAHNLNTPQDKCMFAAQALTCAQGCCSYFLMFAIASVGQLLLAMQQQVAAHLHKSSSLQVAFLAHFTQSCVQQSRCCKLLC
jgi:hypothetical protein